MHLFFAVLPTFSPGSDLILQKIVPKNTPWFSRQILLGPSAFQPKCINVVAKTMKLKHMYINVVNDKDSIIIKYLYHIAQPVVS